MSSEAMDANGAQSGPTRKRGIAGTLVSGGCGCFAFLVGSVVAVAMFAPQLMAGWATRVLEQQLESLTDGDVIVRDVSLSWKEPQRADSVKVYDAEGNRVLEASMRIPSLLELLAGQDVVQRYKVVIKSLHSTIDETGESNLGRTFRVAPEGGSTVLQSLARWGAEEMQLLRNEGGGRAVVVQVELERGLIDDTASGRGEVELRDMFLRVEASSAGLDLALERLNIEAAGRVIPVETELVFGRRRGGPEGTTELVRASLSGEGVPRDVLRTLGAIPRFDVAPRERDPRLVSDVFDRMAPSMLAVVTTILTDADSVEARFGVPASAPQDAPRELHVAVSGATGTFEASARLVEDEGSGSVLVPMGSDALPRFQFNVPGALVPLLDAAAPPGTRAELLSPASAGEASIRPLMGRLSAFALPISAQLLTFERGRFARSRTPADHLARAFRRGEGQLLLQGGDALVLLGSETAVAEQGPRMEVEHVLTDLRFEAGQGSFQSTWRDMGPNQGVRNGARLSVMRGDLPSVNEAPDRGQGELEFYVRGVPMALLREVFHVEDRVIGLLGAELRRLRVQGVDPGVLLGNAPRGGDVELELVTQAGARLEATVTREGIYVPRASFDLPMDRTMVAEVLDPLMPWFERIEALDGNGAARVKVELERFMFPEEALGGGLEGRVRLTPPRLRVRLPDSLLRDLRIDHEGRWVEWTPGEIDVVLDQVGAVYRAVSLPVDGERSVPLSGTSRLGRYNLSGSVPSELLRNLGQSAAGETGQVQIEISNQSILSRPRVLVSPAEFVDALEEIRGLLGEPEKLVELLERMRNR